MHRRAPSTRAAPLDDAVPGSSYKTLILTDYSRMTDDGHLSTMESTSQTFAGQRSVDGTIAQLDQISPQVTALRRRPTRTRRLSYAENLVADSIRNIVLAYRAANPSLKYIVLVGNDHVIPFFRYPDTAGIGPESNYVPPVSRRAPRRRAWLERRALAGRLRRSTTVLDASGGRSAGSRPARSAGSSRRRPR